MIAGVIGIDEVGRGCWAGPLVAGAVLLAAPIEGLRDSKKLSAKRRAVLDVQIRAEAVAFGLGWVTAAEVDLLGLTEAVRLAMHRAVAEITTKHQYVTIIIDGNFNYLPDIAATEFLIKADDLVPAVSAASIIAKVARDNYMIEAAAQHPAYGFEKHVGYGTALHIAGLRAAGVSDLHRKSYKPIQAFLNDAAKA